jgi:hypothetical protein
MVVACSQQVKDFMWVLETDQKGKASELYKMLNKLPKLKRINFSACIFNVDKKFPLKLRLNDLRALDIHVGVEDDKSKGCYSDVFGFFIDYLTENCLSEFSVRINNIYDYLEESEEEESNEEHDDKIEVNGDKVLHQFLSTQRSIKKLEIDLEIDSDLVEGVKLLSLDELTVIRAKAGVPKLLESQKELKILKYRRQPVRKECFEAMSTLSKLEILSIWDCTLNGNIRGLQLLKDLKNLKEIEFARWQRNVEIPFFFEFSKFKLDSLQSLTVPGIF